MRVYCIFLKYETVYNIIINRSSAVGILLALGKEGSSIPIETSTDDIGLFVSTDGGVTWRRTHSGSWLVTFADHAGVITAVQDYLSEQTRELQYSLDEGASWYSYTFSQDKVSMLLVTILLFVSGELECL